MKDFDQTHDKLSIASRRTNFYRHFNRAEWSSCFLYIDPKLREQGKVDLAEYTETMNDFFKVHGPLKENKVIKISVHHGSQSKMDPRDFAYVIASWADKNNKYSHFRERWVKVRDQWFTRVVGLVPAQDAN